MSHVVRVETKVKNFAILGRACTRLGLGQPRVLRQSNGVVQEASVRPRNWYVECRFDLSNGDCLTDDDYLRISSTKLGFDELMHAYAFDDARERAILNGDQILQEEFVPNGQSTLVIEENRASAALQEAVLA